MTATPSPDGKPRYTGRLKRNQDGTLTAVIADAWNWEIHLTGYRDEENGGYRLEGWLGDTPDALIIPLIDRASR